MSEVITTDNVFSESQREVLAAIVDMMIPAVGEMPSAADPVIFRGILDRMAQDGSMVLTALALIESLSSQQSDQAFLQLGSQDQLAVIESFKCQQVELTQLLQLYTVGSYYQDDRVMSALGLEARPPHPGGYEVEASDWSLLDPVRAKQKIYRTT